MSGFVREFGVNPSSTFAGTVVVGVNDLVPAGDALVAAVVTLHGTQAIASASATDTRGNVWHFLGTKVIGSTTGAVHLLYSNITTEMDPGETITITLSSNYTRVAVGVAQFNDYLMPDVSADGDNGGVSWSTLVTAPTGMTADPDELVFGAWGLVNSGRIFTATNGFTGLTKYASTVGSGERAIVAEYKYVASAGQYTANGTLNSSGVAAGVVQTFRLGGGPPARSGRPKVWDGTSWTRHDAKVWDGTQWIPHAMKGYDGSDWLDSK